MASTELDLDLGRYKLGWSDAEAASVLRGVGYAPSRPKAPGEPVLWRQRRVAPPAPPKVVAVPGSPFAALAAWTPPAPPRKSRRPRRRRTAAA